MADNDAPDTPESPAPKPAARRRSTTPAKAAAAKPMSVRRAKAEPADAAAPNKAKAPPKPRTAKRPASPPTVTKRIASRTRAVARSAGDTVAQATDKVGGTWGAAAIGAGVAAIGAAAAAAVLARRKGGSKPTDPATTAAHQADGTDATASFRAGIADEGTIPE